MEVVLSLTYVLQAKKYIDLSNMTNICFRLFLPNFRQFFFDFTLIERQRKKHTGFFKYANTLLTRCVYL